jgi:serine/threonine protein kinase
VNDQGIVKLADFGASKKLLEHQSGMMMTMTMRGTPYFMAPEVFEEKYGTCLAVSPIARRHNQRVSVLSLEFLCIGYESDVWSVGVAIQMITGQPPWLGISNPVALYNHIKNCRGPPPIDQQHENDGAFTAMVSRCFERSPCERPSAEELHDDPFFQHRHIVDDDYTPSIATIFATPSKDPLLAWEHLQSPSTAQSGKVEAGMLNGYRRSNSAVCLKSPLFLSPPIPQNAVLKMANAKLRMNSPAATSPQYESAEWPSWARKALTSDSGQQPESSRSPKGKGNVSPTVAALSQTLGSLALSEDSSAPATRKNLFDFSDVSDNSVLYGEELLETTVHGILHEPRA